MCPEFLRKSMHFDKLHPKNVLMYFPTDENWTLNARPEKIPASKKFPDKFMVRLPAPQTVARSNTSNCKYKKCTKGRKSQIKALSTTTSSLRLLQSKHTSITRGKRESGKTSSMTKGRTTHSFRQCHGAIG
jgi:hypothetical protein